MQQTIDPTVKALVSALGEAETGTSSPDAYTKRGASGEYGRYQFMPDTWNKYASSAGVATPLEQSSIEEQNRVAYQKISEWKQQGYNPAQIASMWNAGEGRPNAYRENWRGVNSQGVAYDTPAYTMKVSEAYQRLKGGQYQGGQQDQPMAGQQQTFVQDVGDSLGEAGMGVASAVGRAASGEINPLSGIWQGIGAVAGGVADVTSDALHHIPLVGDVVKGAEDLIGRGATALAETDLGQSTIQGYQKWAAAHPEAAGNVGAAFNIATAVPILKGVGAAKNSVKGAVSNVLHGKTDSLVDMVSKPLTPKKMAEAVTTRGTVKAGLLRETKLAPDPQGVRIAGVIRKEKIDVSTNKPLLDNIVVLDKKVKEMADELKKKVDVEASGRIYSYKELESALKNIEKPLLIASDTTLNRAYARVLAKAMEIAKKKGGNVGNLLDVRRELDAFIKKQFPNLYRSEQLTPMRVAVRDIRETLNDFTAKNLPDGAGFRESLMGQHLLLKAIENMAEQASKGATKEVGTNVLSRYGRKHPVQKGLIKAGGQAALQGAGIGGVMKILD